MPRRKIREKKSKPVNEISEREIELFLDSIRNFRGYPGVRDLRSLMPSLDALKITTILNYLVRARVIILDSDSNIIWSKGDAPSELTLGEVADISDDLRRVISSSDSDSG